MSSFQVSLVKQVKKNLLALVSLAIAISALSYNTWRNELTEFNRNQRSAGFEILKELAALQYQVDHLYYAEFSKKQDSKSGVNSIVISGWTRVNFIVALSELMNPSVTNKALSLKNVWSNQVDDLVSQKSGSNKEMSNAIKMLSVQVQESLASLK